VKFETNRAFTIIFIALPLPIYCIDLSTSKTDCQPLKSMKCTQHIYTHKSNSAIKQITHIDKRSNTNSEMRDRIDLPRPLLSHLWLRPHRRTRKISNRKKRRLAPACIREMDSDPRASEKRSKSRADKNLRPDQPRAQWEPVLGKM
jgi:hypothetical protein